MSEPDNKPHTRDQLAAIAGLRWRMFVNSLRTTRGNLELLSRIIVSFAFAIGGLGGAVGMGFAAALLIEAKASRRCSRCSCGRVCLLASLPHHGDRLHQ